MDHANRHLPHHRLCRAGIADDFTVLHLLEGLDRFAGTTGCLFGTRSGSRLLLILRSNGRQRDTKFDLAQRHGQIAHLAHS